MNVTIRERVFKNKTMDDSVRYEVTAYMANRRRKYLGIYHSMANAEKARSKYISENPVEPVAESVKKENPLFTANQVLKMAWR